MKQSRSSMQNDTSMPGMPRKVADNDRTPTGDVVFGHIGGVLHRYHYDSDLFLGDRLSQRLKSEQGWFEKLVTHAPSVGTFYEDALRSIVGNILPSTVKVGTGFIFDSSTRRHSKQIDILVYDDSRTAPLYSSGQFVVVSPEMVVAASEVKKSLELRDIRNIITSTVNSYFVNHPMDPPGCHRIYVFSYSSRVHTEKVMDTVVKELSNHIDAFSTKTKTGKQIQFAMNSIVLPHFYFFDRPDNVSAWIRRGATGQCEVTVSKHSGGANDGLGYYLDAMVIEREGNGGIDRRTWFSVPIENYEDKIVSARVPLVQRVSMLQLCERFPAERKEIARFRVNGKQPYMVLLTPCKNIAEIGTFAELQRDPQVGWAVAQDVGVDEVGSAGASESYT